MQEGFFTTNTVNVLQLQQWLRGSCKGSGLVPRTYVRGLTTYNSHARRDDLFRPPPGTCLLCPTPSLSHTFKNKNKVNGLLRESKKTSVKSNLALPKVYISRSSVFFITILIKYLCMKGVLSLCWQTSQSFFKGYI